MAKKPVIETQPGADVQLHENPVVNRVLLNRGIRQQSDLEYSLNRLLDPYTLKGMQDAVQVLEKHIRAGSRIVVLGDFDCDGATSTSIAVEGLRLLGAKDVHFLIPDRMVHGYGLTPSIVALARELEPDLIVTVDNGIVSFDGALAVKNMYRPITSSGAESDKSFRPCELLITDHHLPANDGSVPEAAAIVNPSQIGCEFKSKCIAGCGVMFYVIMALRSHLRKVGYFEEIGVKEPPLSGLVDLVALGTIADVVWLDYNNRVLVDAGLKRIREGRARPGIRALLEIAGRECDKVVSADFGFQLGPRINAAGRLDDMSVGVKCLLSTDYAEAKEIAKELDEFNKARKDLEQHHVGAANETIEKYDLIDRKGVVIHDPTFHAGVVGILASRIKDRINRAILCMTDTDEASSIRNELELLIERQAPEDEIAECRNRLDESYIKGSGRSLPGLHLKHILDAIKANHPEILVKYGGHAAAAGLTAKYKYLDKLTEVFDAEVGKLATEAMLTGSVVVDMIDPPADAINLDLAYEFERLGPWGQGFVEPVFYGHFIVHGKPRDLGQTGKHIRVEVSLASNPGIKFNCVAFNCKEDGEMPMVDSFEAVFKPTVNRYNGRETLQIQLSEIYDPELALQKAMLQDKHEQALREDERRAAEKKALEEAQRAAAAESGARNTRVEGLGKKVKKEPLSKDRQEMRELLNNLHTHRNDGVSPF